MSVSQTSSAYPRQSKLHVRVKMVRDVALSTQGGLLAYCDPDGVVTLRPLPGRTEAAPLWADQRPSLCS